MRHLARITPFFFLACLAVFSQSQEKPRQPHVPYPADWEPKAQELFLPYWTVEPGWSTELEVRNNEPGANSLSLQC